MAYSYSVPGVYVEEKSTGARPIVPVGTSTAGFIGIAPGPKSPVNSVELVTNWTEFRNLFCGDMPVKDPASTDAPWALAYAVYGFFQNGGTRCFVLNVGPGGSITGNGQPNTGIELFEGFDEIAIVLAPGFTDPGDYDAVITHCEKMRDRVAVLDAPQVVTRTTQLTSQAEVNGPSKPAITAVASTTAPGTDPLSAGATPTPADTSAATSTTPMSAADKKKAAAAAAALAASAAAPPATPIAPVAGDKLPDLRARGSDNGFGAFYHPWINIRDPFAPKATITVPPSGHIAGVFARTDATRGVHKAPANEIIRGAIGLASRVSPNEQGPLNDAGVNVIRSFPRDGIRIWGARTLADSSSEWRYLNVRRLFSMIEKSISQSTRWMVFEPNDNTLWKAIRRDVSAFLTLLWQQGALMGMAPEDAFFVKCDAETNPPAVTDLGMVRTLIGIAPVKPAEFVIFEVGQTESGAQVSLAG